MKLDVKAVAGAFGLLWAVAMLLTGVANTVWPGYGQEFLQAMASIYPGYHATGGVGQALIGALYGLLDAVIAGAVFAWLYNLLVSRTS